MKTKEEIKQLAQEVHYVSQYHGLDANGCFNQYQGFIKGYTKCQEDMADKKYTKEDLENAFNSGRGYGVPDNIKDFNSFINSLNKQD